MLSQLSHLLCRNIDGSCGAALLQYATFRHHYTRLRGVLLPPSMPLPHLLAAFTSATTAAEPSASAPPETRVPPSVVDYLIQSCGFSPDEAASICKRPRRSKTSVNHESVLSFFKDKGLEEAQVTKLVSRRPAWLYADVEKTLAPKFRAFEEMGFTGSDLLKILERNAGFLTYSLEKKLLPNICLFQEECGISRPRLLKLLQRCPRVIGRSTSSLKEIIERVRELGLRHGTVTFDMALHITDSHSRSTVDERLAYFKSKGWTEKETLSMIRQYPNILGLSQRKVDEKLAFFKSLGWTEWDTLSVIRRSPQILVLSERRLDERLALFKSLSWTEEETFLAIQRSPVILQYSERKIKDVIDFFVTEAGCTMSFLAANPVLFAYSIEKRVKPRYNVCRILKLKHLPEGDWSLSTLFSLTDRELRDKVILKYVDRFPELNEAFGAGF